jgi:hypothetical protein
MEATAFEVDVAATTPLTWDPDFFKKIEDDKIINLGYKQQFDRNLNLWQSFGISLSVMVSISASIAFLVIHCWQIAKFL